MYVKTEGQTDITQLGYILRLSPLQVTDAKNLSEHIILILDATFVPNLTFLGPLSPEISFGEKIVTHPSSLFHYL